MKTIKNLTADEIRKSILQLAIQGKLVKQDPNDEPASELVKRIYEEKQRLIKEGKISKDKNESYIFKGDDNCYYEKIGKNEPVKLEDLPFDIPDNWCWVRQKDICWLDNGTKEQGEKLPYLEAKVIRGLKEPVILNKGIVVEKNTKVILVDGENSGEIMNVPYRGYMGSTFKIFSATSLFNYQYLLQIFLFKKDLYRNCKTGAAIPHLNKDLFKNSYVAVPPFDEQQRIVDKINSFEPFLEKYDSLEKKLSALEAEFPEKLKKSILQYAIEGKLVKQDPNDEPASVLLERIKAEKEQLIKEGKIKRDKNESYIYQGDDKNYYEKINDCTVKINQLFDIPDSWSFVTMHQLISAVQYGYNGAATSIGKYKLLRITDIQSGKVDWNTLPFCEIDDKNAQNYLIEKYDIYIARTGGTIGKSFLLSKEKENVIFAGYLIRFQFVMPQFATYISKYLQTPFYWNQINDKSIGTGQPDINSKSLSGLIVPLPPAMESKRIMNKIDHLFQQIDE